MMWSQDYRRLSRLETRDDHIAEIAWRDGTLFFAQRPVQSPGGVCEREAVPVACIEGGPHEETQILEGAASGTFYVLSGERTFLSHTRGQEWEEL